MAALQKVRNAGPFVVGALFLGLLGFIATDWAKVVEIFTNADRNTAGIVNGNDISVTDFNKLVDEYTDVVKATQGLSNLTDDQMQNLRDQVWNNYVQNQLIAEEADKLGLTVTDAELQNIISTGANPMLQQKARACVVFGQIADQLEQTFTPVCQVVKVETVQEAVAAAHKLAQRGDVVLFSPGTSSFDQFTGYVQRGQCFRDAVHKTLNL